MSVEKRMIIAVIVSAVIIVVWNLLFMPPPPEPPLGEAEGERPSEGGAPAEGREGAAGEDAVSAEIAGLEGGVQELPAEAIFDDDEIADTVVIESDLYRVALSNIEGGCATSWIMKGHQASFGDGPLDLVAAPEVRPERLLPLATMIRAGDSAYNHLPRRPLLQAVTDGSGRAVFDETGRATVTFRYFEEEVGWIVKELTFRNDSYMLDVRFSSSQVRGGDALIVWGPGIGELLRGNESDGFQPGNERNGYLYSTQGGLQRLPSPVNDRGESGDPFVEQVVQEYALWVGLENAYFMALAVGDARNLFTPIYQLRTGRELRSGEESKTFFYPYVGILPQAAEAEFNLYVGPKDLAVLERTDGGRLSEVVQFGWFAFISRPGLWMLQQIYNVMAGIFGAGNYGVAIVLLTIFINVLLLPLMLKQRASMAAMQKLQPQIKQIQAKYKAERGDSIETRQAKKKSLNEELMALYKAEGVNPMGGCLPMLIQLPILIAFFDMFRVAIELRRAPFMLWIDNLAAPDPFYVTPVLMGIVMYLSQRMTPVASEAQGAAAMKFLPFIFVFFFANAPSGLVLYWLTSSLFSLGTQMVMNAVKPTAPLKAPVRARKGKKKTGRK